MHRLFRYLFIPFIAFGFLSCSLAVDGSLGEDLEQNSSSANAKPDNESKKPVPPKTQDRNDTFTTTINPPQFDKMQRAFLRVDVSELSENELIDATLDEIDELRSYLQDARIKIFNLNDDTTAKDDGSSLTSIDWDPTHDASLFETTPGVNIPIFVTNSVATDGYTVYNKTIGAAGKKANARYIVFGANPMRVTGNSQMQQAMKNAFFWLMERDQKDKSPFSVVIAHLDESYWFKDESKTREWLEREFPHQVTYNSENSCDGVKLWECLDEKTDLLILSQVSSGGDDISQIAQNVNRALENNISVLYIHHDGDLKPLGRELFAKVFDIRYIWDNYWKKLTLKEFDPTKAAISDQLDKIEKMFRHFKLEDYEIDWSGCENGTCSKAADLKEEFLDGASQVRSMTNMLDENKIAIFKDPKRYGFQKLLILSGDKFRQSVSYPMDKIKNDDNQFLRSLYADYSVYNFREKNPAQPDMGNFSRSDFSHIKPVSIRVGMRSKRYFKAAGVYALPGESVTVKRYDNSDVKVKVFINTLRFAATHEYAKDGYKRPKFLQTPHFEINPQETIVITSPYGGPIELEFDKNDQDIDIGFENVAKHPFWASEEDSAEFAKKLQESEFDWAEIVTDGFEVHSTLKKLKESLSDEKFESVDDFVKATKEYISNFPHALAGFEGSGIDAIDEVVSFAKEHNLTVEKIDIVKHMNADQATCGYGCSGNPYDAYWAFSPFFHGDLHELGHGLESSRLRFEGFSYHSTTNPYSYYSKSKYYETTKDEPGCQKLPFKELFENIRKSINEKNSTQYLKENFWNSSNWSHQVLVTIEAMMHVQKLGKLQNGWHLLSRLHILDREIKRVKNDWENKKASIGFDRYSLDEFKSMRKNDWLLVSFSFASGLDFRDYFDMMGIEYSQKASDQVESFAYERVPAKLFVSTSDGYCKSDEYGTLLDKSMIDVKEGTVFPY